MTPGEREFLRRFEDCTLPREQWSHTAHIRMAWLQLGCAPFEPALARIRTGLQRFADVVFDAASEYHETTTVAFTRLIAGRMRPTETFEDFAARNPDLFASEPILRRYYSADVLASERARHEFVEPDRQPLPDMPADDTS